MLLYDQILINGFYRREMVKKKIKHQARKAKKKVRAQVKKVKKTVKKKAKFQAKSYLFRTLYLTGLTAIIPAVVINAAPTELAFLQGTPFNIMVAAIFLVVVGTLGIFDLHGKGKEGFNALALTTLIPGGIAIAITFGLDSIITNLLGWMLPDIEQLQIMIDLYIERAIPRVGFLILGYVSIGGLWYLLGKVRK